MYNKIFTKILDSSVWLEPTATRIVWITLLAAMDENGFCAFAAVGNVAGRARVTIEEARAALKILESPDPESSDPDNEGRRVERVSGGWVVLNATKYREIVSRANAQEKTNERVRRFREKKRNGNGSETLCNDSETPSEAYTGSETEIPPKPPVAKEPDSVDTRVLCDHLGIFNIREQEAMNRCYRAFVVSSKLSVEHAREHMLKRWDEYKAKMPTFEWSYGSAYKLFMSGTWNDPTLWPPRKPDAKIDPMSKLKFFTGGAK